MFSSSDGDAGGDRRSSLAEVGHTQLASGLAGLFAQQKSVVKARSSANDVRFVLGGRPMFQR